MVTRIVFLCIAMTMPLATYAFSTAYEKDNIRERAQANIMRRPAVVNRESDAVLIRQLFARNPTQARSNYLIPATLAKLRVVQGKSLNLKTIATLIARTLGFTPELSTLTQLQLNSPVVLQHDYKKLGALMDEIAHQTGLYGYAFPDAKLIAFYPRKTGME